jgi:succinate dehydrogenase/fumarate reductase flavoprotein subunit
MNETRHTVDILIIGGSLAGLCTAIKVKELNPKADVLIVEKYTTGYAGKANRGACNVLTLNGEFTPEEFTEFIVRYNGEYLNDQDQLLNYARNLTRTIDHLDRWTGRFSKRDGKFRPLKWTGQFDGVDENGKPIPVDSVLPWRQYGLDNDYVLELRKTALKVGVRIINRVGVVDLLTKDGAVIGALGFGLDGGERHIFSARAVALATGCQNWRIMAMWSCGRGEGIRAAWRAGARIANAEFGSFCNWVSLHNFESVLGAELALYNTEGLNIGIPYRRVTDSDIEPRTIAEWYRNMRSGLGPIEYREEDNLHEHSDSRAKIFFSTEVFDRPRNDKFWGDLLANAGEGEGTGAVHLLPGIVGECAPLWVDRKFRTSVQNLYGSGEVCYTGSGLAGALPSPMRTRGGGIACNTHIAIECGITLAEELAGLAPIQEPDEQQIERYTAEMFAPLSNTDGFEPAEVLTRIQSVMNDIGVVIYKDADRVANALEKVNTIEMSLEHQKATDIHGLFNILENKAMTLCSQFFFIGSYLREESRGWQLREDFPGRDDENWLKWIVYDNVDGQIKPSYLPIPMETYPFKP